jgi:branched-chain amino acid transport system substrate-binding protein
MGSILPITGEASPFGPDMQNAVNLAAEQINDAGGVLGRELEVVNKDSGTKPDTANQRYRTLVNEDEVIGITGAVASSASVSIAENIAEDGVMQISNGSTSPQLANMATADGLKYFARTAPNDAQQGIAMAEVLQNDDFIGADTAGFIGIDDPYGQGLMQKAQENFDGEVVASVSVSRRQSDYTSALEQLFDEDPDGVGAVLFPTSAQTVLKQWDEGGFGGEWVLSETLDSEETHQELAPITEGMYITTAAPKESENFQAYLDLGGPDNLFAPHAYDALFLKALALEAGEEATGATIAENVQSISNPPGTAIGPDDFETAKDLLGDGEQINYQGASSPVNLNDALEPLVPFSALQVREGAEFETVENFPRSFFE